MMNRKGFTLFEIMIALVVLSILLAVGYRSYSGRVKTANIQATANYMTGLIQACNDWRLANGTESYASISMNALVSGGFWANPTAPTGSTTTVAPKAGDNYKVVITVPAPSASGFDGVFRSNVVSILGNRGLTAYISGENIVVEQ